MKLLTALFVGLTVLVLCCHSQRKPELNLCEQEPGVSPNGDELPYVGSNMIVFMNLTNLTKQRCLMKFSTCNKCRINVTTESKFSFPTCKTLYNIKDATCIPGCTYLQMFDYDYRNDTMALFSNDMFPQYVSESSKLYIVVCSYNSHVLNIQFKLRLQVEEKYVQIKGSSYDPPSGYKNVRSPFFPHPYVENNEEYLYEFKAVNRDDYIQLIFDDWDLSPTTSIKFENTNVNGNIYGTAPRPSVLSNNHWLKFHFYTGSNPVSNFHRYMGFKVTYKFYNKSRYVPRAETNCGGYLLKSDGGTLMFSSPSNVNEYYDCIWVVKVQPGYTAIYTRLEAYEVQREFEAQNRLEIRIGLTSMGGLKASVSPGNVDASKLYGHDSTTGFYFRLTGRYRDANDFILTYASYKYGECNSDKFFKCDNRKCINASLMCDGYNHCGDGSDEKEDRCNSSGSTNTSPYSYTLSVGVIIPIVISVFLIVVICLLIVFIRRCRKLSLLSNDDTQRINTVSGQNQRGRRRRNRQRISMNLTISQDAPPTYEEVIRSTPIGHLNMAFMWSQPEVTMIQPPSYEEAISPQGDQLPQLLNSHNVSSSSSEMVGSVPGPSPVLSSSTEGSSQQRSRQVSSSSSNTSAYSDNNDWTVQTNRSYPNNTESTPQRRSRHKLAQDEIIESLVSSSSLHDKPHDSHISDVQSVESVKPRSEESPKRQRECGMPYSTNETTPNDGVATSSRHRDVDPKTALKEFVARKQEEKRIRTRSPSEQGGGGSHVVLDDECSRHRSGASSHDAFGSNVHASSSKINSESVSNNSSNSDNINRDIVPTDMSAHNFPSRITENDTMDRYGTDGPTQLYLSLQLNSGPDEEPDIYV